MPSSFVGRAAVLPRVSLVGAVAHISSDLFTEGIYGRSIRAYTDVQGCNRFLVCALENVSKKRTFFFCREVLTRWVGFSTLRVNKLRAQRFHIGRYKGRAETVRINRS